MQCRKGSYCLVGHAGPHRAPPAMRGKRNPLLVGAVAGGGSAGARRSWRWEQAELAGVGDRFGPAAHPELAVDGLDLAADGVDRDRQLPADLSGGQLGGEQPQDREFSLGEGRGNLGCRRGAVLSARVACLSNAGITPGSANCLTSSRASSSNAPASGRSPAECRTAASSSSPWARCTAMASIPNNSRARSSRSSASASLPVGAAPVPGPGARS